MSYLHKKLTDSLYAYLQPVCAATGTPELVFGYDNGVEANGDYIVVDIKKITSDSNPEVIYLLKEDVLNNECVLYRGTASIALDIYTEKQALFVAEQIKANLRRERTHELALKHCLGLVSCGDTLNLSSVQNGRYRHRTQFELNINYVFSYKSEDITVGQLTVKGDVDNKKYLVEETISDNTV